MESSENLIESTYNQDLYLKAQSNYQAYRLVISEIPEMDSAIRDPSGYGRQHELYDLFSRLTC